MSYWTLYVPYPKVKPTPTAADAAKHEAAMAMVKEAEKYTTKPRFSMFWEPE